MYERKKKNEKIDGDKLFEECKRIIKENINVVCIDDMVSFLPVSEWSIDKYIPAGEERRNELYRLMDMNKTKTKRIVRDRLMESNSPAALIALYKLYSNADEREALQMVVREKQTDKQEVTLKIE